MNNKLTYLVIILVALIIGWIIGYFFTPQNQAEVKTVYIDKIQKKIVHDTVKVSTPIYIQKEAPDTSEELTSDSKGLLDSNLVEVSDTTQEVFDEDIMTEKMMGSRDLKIEWITVDSLDVSEMLNKKASSFNETITVEFWQSPLNLTGYELNRNKLKLFGFNPTESISLQVKDDKKELIMKTSSFELSLPKTNQFKSIEL